MYEEVVTRCQGGELCPVYVATLAAHSEDEHGFLRAMLGQGGFHPASPYSWANAFSPETVSAWHRNFKQRDRDAMLLCEKTTFPRSRRSALASCHLAPHHGER